MLSTIKDFFGGLMEKTEKETIMTRFDEVFAATRKTVLPMVQLPDEVGSKTKTMRLIESRFKSRNIPVEAYRRNPVRFIRETVDLMLKNEQAYREIFESRFKKDVLKAALDFEATELLYFLKALDFFNIYTRRVMLVLHTQELELPAKPIDIEYREFVENPQVLDSFAVIVNALHLPVAQFASSLSKLKDVSFDPNTADAIERLRGKDNVDPLSLGLIPVVGDVVLFFGELSNTWVKYRYDLAVEERTRLELQVLYLERKAANASGEELARIQKQIEYYGNRINVLQAKIEDAEADAKGYEYD